MIVRSVADLARNMGMVTVAEGVEDQQIFATLQELGIGQAQGYHLSKPMPAAEFPAWLDSYNDALRGGPRPVLPGGRRPRSRAVA
jgi:EAL domain-containing protein (putative c-di-GMP-specific phosphodiesterase class I)